MSPTDAKTADAPPAELPSPETLAQRIAECPESERGPLRHKLRRIKQARAQGKPYDRNLARLARQVDQATKWRQRRLNARPKITYPAELPISQKRAEIAEAIAANQVTIVCGETGSGKTTQLPKICLELGRGIDATVGHTQPRRIAARTVADRIASELSVPLGKAVGYKVRFGDQTGRDTLVKLMTDGILLAEIQGDPELRQYDTLIIDEAHERSLNIDFLLGYLKQLLPKRPDLKLIITSATIDPDRFSRHFDEAPIINVSGRTYPVEVRYRPPAELLGLSEPDDGGDPDASGITNGSGRGETPEEPIELPQAIVAVAEELCREGPGDILVFLSGEREIRDAAKELEGFRDPTGHAVEVLPLFARLSSKEQDRVFRPHQGRRIVLATNVAETSLTVPGIRYVIDTGLARISRYSPRRQVQRLPIEPISQASANQRAGRCGRVQDGVCIRLYEEADFLARPLFTPPEIVRTNLAEVILQMLALGFGQIEHFPFVDPPKAMMVRDGYQTLHEIGAVDELHDITDIGRDLARLPTDPRVGRMILAGHEENVLSEVVAIAAGLSIQDPRERPMDQRQKADEAHAAFRDESSDFLTLLKLWHFWRGLRQRLSWNQLRKAAKQNFLNYQRMREWEETVDQLREQAEEAELKFNDPDVRESHPAAIHRALLTGLLGHVGCRADDKSYHGPHDKKFYLFPGSGLFHSRPKWVMAAELVETTKLYARTVGPIQVEWLEKLAPHLIRKSHSQPRWDVPTARVLADEKVSLFGLTIVPRRRVHFGPINPYEARKLFIQHALVDGAYETDAEFFEHNRKLLADLEQEEAKRRETGLVADAIARFNFYDERIPRDVYSGRTFENWRKKAEKRSRRILFMSRRDLVQHEAAPISRYHYPDNLTFGSRLLPLDYHLEPGHEADGVTATLSLTDLAQIEPERFEWLVPGLLPEKLIALIRGLPKDYRRALVPAPDVVDQCLEHLEDDQAANRPLLESFTAAIEKVTGVRVPADAWPRDQIDDHLQMNFRIVDEKGKTLATGRNLYQMRDKLAGRVQKLLEKLQAQGFRQQRGLTNWDFGPLPEAIDVEKNGMSFTAYPGLKDRTTHVDLKLFEHKLMARRATRRGVARLLRIQLDKPLRSIVHDWPDFDRLALHYAPLGSKQQLMDMMLMAIVDRAMVADRPAVMDEANFRHRLDVGWNAVGPMARHLYPLVAEILKKRQDVEQLLGEKIPPSWHQAHADLKHQLANLVPADFLLRTEAAWLPHLPRYLDGIVARHRKLRQNGPDWDRQRRGQFIPWWQQFAALAKKQWEQGVHDPTLHEFRWLLEEYRIHLFAQELRTAVPISEKRLEQHWAKVQHTVNG